MLLNVHALKRLSTADQQAGARHAEIQAHFETYKKMLSGIERNASAHRLALQTLHLSLDEVNKLVSGDIKADQEKTYRLLASHGYVKWNKEDCRLI